jgi:hypothetical protein
MDDNRYNSSDSRFRADFPDPLFPYRLKDGLGFVPRDRVVAKAWVHFWPFDRVKLVRPA